MSNVSTAEFRQALATVRVESVQNRCNPTDQGDLKSGLVRACAEEGVTYLAYSPVGGHNGHKRMGRHRALTELAKRHGTSPQCIILAWLLGKGAHVVPIPGASRVASIERVPLRSNSRTGRSQICAAATARLAATVLTPAPRAQLVTPIVLASAAAALPLDRILCTRA